MAKNTEPSGTGRGEPRVAAMWPAKEKGPELGLKKQAEDSSPGATQESKHFTLYQWEARGAEYADLT